MRDDEELVAAFIAGAGWDSNPISRRFVAEGIAAMRPLIKDRERAHTAGGEPAPPGKPWEYQGDEVCGAALRAH